MKTTLENWNEFLKKEARKSKRKQLREQYITEISKTNYDNVMSWYQGDYDKLSFDDLFDGKLRRVIELNSDDAVKLYDVVNALEKEGWYMPEDPDDASWRKRRFPTRFVKQKLRRAGTGEEYYVEKVIADLELVRTRPYEIPKGPRAGEIINKSEKTTMSKAINRLEGVSSELKDWWQKKQIYYTNDSQWKTVEKTFRLSKADDDRPEPMNIILSRHPLDVLRMSDISGINSCHSEGHSHFECAIAESKGHGPIAYLVSKSELEELMSGKYTRESKNQPVKSPDSPATIRAKKEAAKWIQDVILFGQIPRSSKLFDVLSKNIDDPEQFEFALDAIYDAPHLKYKDLSVAARSVIGDEVIVQAVRAKMKSDGDASEWLYQFVGGEKAHEEAIEPEHQDISELDEQEIFKDNQRSIRGIGVKSRVRLRKFTRYDSAEGEDIEFAIPEVRIYGQKVAGFGQAVQRWAFQNQRDKFETDEDGNVIPPRLDSLTRYGGSYEDNKDGYILHSFFSENGVEESYNQNYNVDHDIEDEIENQFAIWENQVEELNRHAENSLPSDENWSVYANATVEEYGDDQPYLSVSSGVQVSIDIPGLKYDENGEPVDKAIRKIPGWNDDWDRRRQWDNLLDGAPVIDDYWTEETMTEVQVDKEGNVSVEIRWDINAEANEPDEFDNFIDGLGNDFGEDTGSRIMAHVLREMISSGYAPTNSFDILVDVYEEDEWDEEENPEEFNLQQKWKERIAGLNSFNFERYDDEGHLLYFGLADQPGHGLQAIDLNLPVPPEFMHMKFGKQTPNISMIADAVGGNREQGKSATIEHTSAANDRIARELSAIEAEANKYAANQLKFDFGLDYDLSDTDDATIDFSSDVKFRTMILQPKDKWGVYSSIEVVLRYDMDEEQIEFAMNTLEYIDKNLKKVASALNRLLGLALGEYAEKFRKNRDAARTTSKERVKEKIENLRAKGRAESDNPTDPARRSHLALALWASRVYDQMSMIEKRVLIDDYIDPLLKGEKDYIDPQYAVPMYWQTKVFNYYRQLGAPGQVARDYRYEHEHSYQVAWDEVGRPDVERGETLAGSLGEPRPAQESATKDFTGQDIRAIIREVLIARGILDETGA